MTFPLPLYHSLTHSHSHTHTHTHTHTSLSVLLPFLPTLGEVKTLMIQLLRAVHHLHDNWILHRDLKASNLLLSHKGILKVHTSAESMYTKSSWCVLLFCCKYIWGQFWVETEYFSHVVQLKESVCSLIVLLVLCCFLAYLITLPLFKAEARYSYRAGQDPYRTGPI